MTWLPAKANRGKTLEPYKKCQSNLEIEPSIVVKKVCKISTHLANGN
jgi:hypothetical protein